MSYVKKRVTLGDASKKTYLCTMFVHKKSNRSGTISVVVVSKAHGKFTEVKKFGVAKSEEESDELFRKAQLWLHTHDGQQEFDFDDRKGKEVEETERFLSNIDNVLINGSQYEGFTMIPMIDDFKQRFTPW